MGFNYGSESRKFKKQWDVLRVTYANAGMSKDDIQAMQDYDWKQIKSNRRFQTHNQGLDGLVFSDGDVASEDNSPLLKKNLEQMSTSLPGIWLWSRYDWIEDIDSPELLNRLKKLTGQDIELLTYLITDGLNQAEVSRKLGVSRAAITKKINRLRKLLSNI